MTIRDREVIAALRDDPDLLAIADALSTARTAAPRRRRTRRWAGGAAVMVGAAAALLLLLLAPWDRGGARSLTARALAAVGERPVFHARLRFALGERVDLSAGRSSPVFTDVEYWYDPDGHVLHAVVRRDGHVMSDTTTRGTLGFEAPTTAADIYRRALERGAARRIGEGKIRGVDVIWVEFPATNGVMRAALDAHTYELKRLLYLVGRRVTYRIDVLLLETVSRADAHLPPPRAVDSGGVRSGSGSSTGSAQEISPACARSSRSCEPPPDLKVARTAFDRPALWPGPAVRGRPLRSVDTTEEEAKSGHRRAHARELHLGYGSAAPPADTHFLSVDEAPASAAKPLWEIQGDYPPAPGLVDITSGGESTGQGRSMRTRWTGLMQKNGFYLRLESWSRDALLTAARSLRTVPPG